MNPVSVTKSGDVVFEFDNLLQRSSGARDDKFVRITVPPEKLLKAQALSADVGRIVGDSGKRTKELLDSVDEE